MSRINFSVSFENSKNGSLSFIRLDINAYNNEKSICSFHYAIKLEITEGRIIYFCRNEERIRLSNIIKTHNYKKYYVFELFGDRGLTADVYISVYKLKDILYNEDRIHSGVTIDDASIKYTADNTKIPHNKIYKLLSSRKYEIRGGDYIVHIKANTEFFLNDEMKYEMNVISPDDAEFPIELSIKKDSYYLSDRDFVMFINDGVSFEDLKDSECGFIDYKYMLTDDVKKYYRDSDEDKKTEKKESKNKPDSSESESSDSDDESSDDDKTSSPHNRSKKISSESLYDSDDYKKKKKDNLKKAVDKFTKEKIKSK